MSFSLSLLYAEPLVWFTSKFTLSAHSVWLATQWPSVMIKWQRVEQNFPTNPVQKRRNSPFTRIGLMVVVISVIIFSWVWLYALNSISYQKRFNLAFLLHFTFHIKKIQLSIHWAYRWASFGRLPARTVRNSRRLYFINRLGHKSTQLSSMTVACVAFPVNCWTTTAYCNGFSWIFC